MLIPLRKHLLNKIMMVIVIIIKVFAPNKTKQNEIIYASVPRQW